MELCGFMIDDKIVDEITDRILIIHSRAEYRNTPLVDCRQTIRDAVEDVLTRHNIVPINPKYILTNLEKEDI